MIKEALQYVIGLNKPFVEEIHRSIYTDKALTRVKVPSATPLPVKTLSALLDYIKDNKDGLLMDQMMIHVESPIQVTLISNLFECIDRDCYMTATALVPEFSFGRFYDTESFNIAMQAMFVESEDRGLLIRMAGNLVEDVTKTSVDDGMTQTATIRKGIQVKGYETVPNPVLLQPYRTFVEVDQPTSKFVFRIQDGGKLALFEADGGAWRNAAMQNIKEYLKHNLEIMNIPLTVLA